MEPAYLLGIDGGGTRTTAWVADLKLRVLGRGEGGPSNPLKAGFTPARRELLHAAEIALRQAHIPGKALAGVCAGIAGVDRPAVQQPLLRWMRGALPAPAHLITSDAAITLQTALKKSAGVVVIAGTGSIAYGRTASGQPMRAGGWGSLFDDGGSGYQIARQAVTAALRSHDGRGPSTRLNAALCKALKIDEVTRVVLQPFSFAELAALFPVVLNVAAGGDAVARRILRDAAEELAGLALALLKKGHWLGAPVPVVCTGGVFRSAPTIRRSFSRFVRLTAPKAKIRLMQREPVEGALELAHEAFQLSAQRQQRNV